MADVERPAMQAEATEVLQRLIRFNTVNPPGNEREAAEYLGSYVRAAGFETELLGLTPERPSLIATLHGHADGPTLVYLGHIDTVLADPEDWQHDPWGGELIDGHVWGRGAIDMKSQVAAEAVAAVTLARSGWRPARGTLKLIFVADEETGGAAGARWLTEQHPEKVRCDMLLNEGTGSTRFEIDGQRYYGVCCGEKGIFRFRLTATGQAGHASMPRMGDNALMKLTPALQRLRAGSHGHDPTTAALALIEALGEDPGELDAALARLGAKHPAIPLVVEPMLSVTLTPTMIQASEKLNVIPARASVRIDTRVPPGLGPETALKRLHDVLGETAEGLEIEFTEQVYGYVSPHRSALMDAIERWIETTDPGAKAVPALMPAYSDSSWFRRAFPELVAYGFFPQRHQSLIETTSLMHNADERIDVRDLGYAADCYAALARDLLG